MEKINLMGLQVPTNFVWGVGGLVLGAIAAGMIVKKNTVVVKQEGNPDTFGTKEVVLENPLTPATGVVTLRNNTYTNY